MLSVRGKKHLSHAHKTGSWHLLGVLYTCMGVSRAGVRYPDFENLALVTKHSLRVLVKMLKSKQPER